MKSILIFLIFCQSLVSLSVYSQINDTINLHNSSIRINVAGIPFKSVQLFVDQKIKGRNYLELMIGYKPPKMDISNTMLGSNIHDPIWYYSRMRASFGINHRSEYNNQRYYGAYLQYKYLNLKKHIFEDYINHEGDESDEDWQISRVKQQFGLSAKFGYILDMGKHYIADIYVAAGTKIEFKTEKIWSMIECGSGNLKIVEWENGNSKIVKYPIINKSKTILPAFACGLCIGFCKIKQ